MQKRGPFTEFSLFLFDAYARWKGTGEPWSNFTLKVLKIFPRHFWKIFSFLISLYSPLSHGIWILVQHPSIETLAFLEHSDLWMMSRYLRVLSKYFWVLSRWLFPKSWQHKYEICKYASRNFYLAFLVLGCLTAHIAVWFGLQVRFQN